MFQLSYNPHQQLKFETWEQAIPSLTTTTSNKDHPISNILNEKNKLFKPSFGPICWCVLEKNRPGNNRLGGNSLLECAVFGRLAGANAAEKALKETETFESQVWNDKQRSFMWLPQNRY